MYRGSQDASGINRGAELDDYSVQRIAAAVVSRGEGVRFKVTQEDGAACAIRHFAQIAHGQAGRGESRAADCVGATGIVVGGVGVRIVGSETGEALDGRADWALAGIVRRGGCLVPPVAAMAGDGQGSGGSGDAAGGQPCDAGVLPLAAQAAVDGLDRDGVAARFGYGPGVAGGCPVGHYARPFAAVAPVVDIVRACALGGVPCGGDSAAGLSVDGAGNGSPVTHLAGRWRRGGRVDPATPAGGVAGAHAHDIGLAVVHAGDGDACSGAVIGARGTAPALLVVRGIGDVIPGCAGDGVPGNGERTVPRVIVTVDGAVGGGLDGAAGAELTQLLQPSALPARTATM